MKFVITGQEASRPFHKHWQFCVGSCHAKMAMRADYARQLKQVHDELGIRRVRFHGILNDDMETINVLDAPGGFQFREQRFHNCGVVYDNVLSTGMKPVVELSFMPKQLGRSKEEGIMWYVGNITPPADEEAWIAYISDFIRYLEHRYGAEEVRTWLFEVWN